MDISFDLILKLARKFESLAASEKEELPENSDNLRTVLKNLSSLETFNARKEYADKNLEKLASGSARAVYFTKDKKQVVKLAANEKGLAQNKAESNPKIDSKFANTVIDHDDDYIWLLAPLLDKITEKEFEELCDINFKLFGEAVKYAIKKDLQKKAKAPENFEELEKTPIIKEMVRLCKDFNLTTGDIARISSWGTDGKNPVLIDLGLTREIYREYYSDSKSKSKSKTKK